MKLLAFGDICLSCYGEHHFNDHSYNSLISKFSDYDGLIFGNLECVLSNYKNLNYNKISLSCDAKMLNYISYFNIFSLANNHIYDVGEEGIRDTINALDKNNIKYFGFGKNIYEARKPLIIEKNNMKIGFLGYSCLTTNGENYATAVKQGVSPIALDYLKKDISKLKKEVDCVILSFHWGEENKHFPTPDQIMIAHRAIDYGAKIIIGTHSHVIQGVEEYNGGIICYSLGNYLFSNLKYNIMRKNEILEEELIQSELNKESISIEFLIDKKNIVINKVQAYKNNDLFLPTEVELKDLNTNFEEINKKLKHYVKKKKKYIDKIKDLQMEIEYNGTIYQNHYVLPTIDETENSFFKRIRTIYKNLKGEL